MKISVLLWRTLAYGLHKIHSSYSVPTALGLCMTSECNLRCSYCMTATFVPPKGSLTLKQVKYLLKKMPYISTICIQGLCEPFLNPETPAILSWLKSQGYHISFTTNGTVPLTGKILESTRNVDDFVISIDTADPETFAELRRGAKLETVMLNLKRVIDMKKRLGLTKHDNPPIHINAVVTTKNFHQMKDLIRMLGPLSKDLTYLMVDPVSRPDYSVEAPLALIHDKQFEKDLVDLREFVKTSQIPVVGLDYMLEPSYDWKDCPIAPMNLWLEPNGDMYYFYDFNYVFGNAFTDNPLRAFNNKKARLFRQKLQTNNPPLQQCHSCNFARKGWQLQGGYLDRTRVLSGNKPMTFYEAVKHVLKVLTRKGRYTF